MKTKEETRFFQLHTRIRILLRKEKENIVLHNPYKEEINDIVEYVALFFVQELYPYKELFIMTDESVEKKIGSGAKYVWYRSAYVESFVASLILHDILKHNNNNLRIKTKLKEYYKEALKRLQVFDVDLTKINKDEIVRLSN